MIAADRLQRAMRRSTRSHVVLGMDLEETALPAGIDDRRQVLGLEARAGDAADRDGIAERHRRRVGLGCLGHGMSPLLLRCRAVRPPYTGLSEPILPFGRLMLVQ